MNPKSYRFADAIIYELEGLIWSKHRRWSDPVPLRSPTNWNQLWILAEIEPWSHMKLLSNQYKKHIPSKAVTSFHLNFVKGMTPREPSELPMWIDSTGLSLSAGTRRWSGLTEIGAKSPSLCQCLGSQKKWGSFLKWYVEFYNLNTLLCQLPGVTRNPALKNRKHWRYNPPIAWLV